MKPGFFTNEDLCELSPWHRLCFAGLWTLADREGRLEDRPRRIKAALFPYDSVDIDAILETLAEKDFVIRYTADGAAYLAIPTFLKHQRPKTDETLSLIPAPILTDPRGKAIPPRPYNGHRTEGSGQRTEGKGAEPALVGDTSPTPPCAADGVADMRELWNSTTSLPIPRCRDITTKRRRHIRARLTERPLTEWRPVFARIQASAFCRGENDRGWAASFDWVIGSPDVAVKVLEGKYDNRRNGKGPPPAPECDPWECPHSPRCGNRSTCAIVAARRTKAS